jgi:hypothetical protein
VIEEGETIKFDNNDTDPDATKRIRPIIPVTFAEYIVKIGILHYNCVVLLKILKKVQLLSTINQTACYRVIP